MRAPKTGQTQREADAVMPLVQLPVTTRHPWDYVLINEADGTRWRGTADGSWRADDKGSSGPTTAQRVGPRDDSNRA